MSKGRFHARLSRAWKPVRQTMRLSAREVFNQVKASLPGSLVCDSAADFLARIPARMPAGSACYYLECRLTESMRVDVEAAYPHSAAIPMLQGLKPAVETPFVLLEWDQAGAGSAARPGLLLCLDRRMGIGACGKAVPRLRKASLLAAAEAVCRHWLGKALDRSASDSLLDCFAKLPRGGRLLHLSAMPARNPPLLKLNIALPAGDFPGYLRRVGWKGDSRGLARIWKALGPCAREAKFDLILRDGVHPKLGVELFPSNSSPGCRESALGIMAASRWIRPDKGRDLQGWRGTLWRVDSRHGRVFRIDRDFGLKIVLDEAGEIRPKGYLQFLPRFATYA